MPRPLKTWEREEGGEGKTREGWKTEGENKEREGKKGGRGRTRKKRDEEGMGEVGGWGDKGGKEGEKRKGEGANDREGQWEDRPHSTVCAVNADLPLYESWWHNPQHCIANSCEAKQYEHLPMQSEQAMEYSHSSKWNWSQNRMRLVFSPVIVEGGSVYEIARPGLFTKELAERVWDQLPQNQLSTRPTHHKINSR